MTAEKRKTSVETRALATHELLFRFLNKPENQELDEFTKGGISACCIILGVENPITRNEYGGTIVDTLLRRMRDHDR